MAVMSGLEIKLGQVVDEVKRTEGDRNKKWLRNTGHKAEIFWKVLCENIVARKGKFKAFGSDKVV